uniref:Protein sprint n=1 Tax=Ceratitis capitata TaxID=7213 RepID=W8ANM9_CERCA
MNWFKKLSSEGLANLRNRVRSEQQRHKRIKKTSEQGSTPETTVVNRPWHALATSDIEIVDPEIFFHDPDHVRNYREEAEFLELMSEWEFVTNPASLKNFFSADFEDELLQHRLAQDEESTVCDTPLITEQDEPASSSTCTKQYTVTTKNCRKRKAKSRLCAILLFKDKIQLGLILPAELEAHTSPNHMRCKRTKSNDDTHGNSVSTIASSISSLQMALTGVEEKPAIQQVIKDCAINRRQLKTEAIASSIMGAIGKCPDRDGTPRSSADDLITSTVDQCHPSQRIAYDHYDIKQFFRLDDHGNILLNISHITEIKGFGLTIAQNKRLYKRYRKLCQAMDEKRENCVCVEIFKRLILALWHAISGHPRNKLNALNGGPGELVRACTLQLAQDPSSTFARNIENFICCTKESREAAPQVVMRNMRQFMNGMKNYLVKHGEGKFHQEIEAARSRLKSDEFLNLDAILETVMHELVVLPLREHLYGMFVDYYKRSEDIQLLAQNVKYACGRCPADFGMRATVTPPSQTSLQIISALLQRLQEAELPLEKLELFLCVISTIFEATGCPRGQQLGADDFLPVLVYVVAKCGFVGAEIEAEFMWGLLQPTLLSGEAGYYLTALCSAVHVLKSFMSSESENGTGSLDWRSSSLPACSSVLRVIIPDECNGSLQTRTLPVRPHTTTREVCRIIAHKARITNPQDYALFKLVDGEETLLNDVECPQDVRFASKGKHCMLAYKRIDAKIAWPTATN